MHYVLVILAFLFLAIFAPPKVTATVLIATLIIGFIGQKTAELVTGSSYSIGDGLRAVGLALMFQLVLVFTLISFSRHDPFMSAMISLPVFLTGYVMAFKLSMDLDVLPACLVAAVTTGVAWLVLQGALMVLVHPALA